MVVETTPLPVLYVRSCWGQTTDIFAGSITMYTLMNLSSVVGGGVIMFVLLLLLFVFEARIERAEAPPSSAINVVVAYTLFAFVVASS